MPAGTVISPVSRPSLPSVPRPSLVASTSLTEARTPTTPKQLTSGFDSVKVKPVDLSPRSTGVNTAHPWLQKMGSSRLSNGATGTCVATTMGNMDRLGIPSFSGGTTRDPNNSRGAMVQLIQTGRWSSMPLPGSEQRTINSAYGKVQANVLGADAYEAMAKRGEIPTGAILFQTRHGWNADSGAKGNDMGIVRDGGRVTHNYQPMNPIIYSNAKEVVVLVPSAAMGN